jgi:hypothetical protein
MRAICASRAVSCPGVVAVRLPACSPSFAAPAEESPGTSILWLLCRGAVENVFGRGDADQLPARGALGQRAAAAVEAGHIDAVRGFRTAEVRRTGDSLVLVADDGRRWRR